MIAYEHDQNCGWLPGFYRHHDTSAHRCPDIKCAFLATISRRLCALCGRRIGYSTCYVAPPGHFRLYHTACVDAKNGHTIQETVDGVHNIIPPRPPAYGEG